MSNIVLFGEDSAHRLIVGEFARRILGDFGRVPDLKWRSSVGGHARVVDAFGRYVRKIREGSESFPEFVVVATDANCIGHSARTAAFDGFSCPFRLVLAIPDPHVERWLLLDGAAIRAVFGKGIDAPDKKCERGRYKRMLSEAARASGESSTMGGIEYTAEIVRHMDLDRAARADRSFGRFVADARAAIKGSAHGAT